MHLNLGFSHHISDINDCQDFTCLDNFIDHLVVYKLKAAVLVIFIVIFSSLKTQDSV